LKVTFAPVRVAGVDEEGALAFLEDDLVAVLTHLGSDYAENSGRWYLETGFGRLDGHDHPSFVDLAEAGQWIEASLVKCGAFRTNPAA
jgi:hypothetical protein